MAIRMGYWDCPHCQHKKIEGPQRQCPQCGRPRDNGVQFYTTDDAPEVNDPALLQRARAGADWHCPFCDTDNPAGQQACLSCGATDPSARQRQQRVIPAAPTAVPSSKPVRKGGKGGLLIALGVLALVVLGAWLLFFRTKPHTVVIERSTWIKTLVVERLETRTESAWADEVPSGGREIRRELRGRERKVQDGTERVKVGQKDLGNGMFEDVYEDRPRYVTRRFDEPWVTYEIDRWVQDRTLKEERSDGTEPPAPNAALSPRLREGARESYVSLDLQGDGTRYSYRIDVKDAESKTRAITFKVGQKVTAMVNAVGGVRDLK
jgi:predicted nucleic acid-binding Zn ribbon protein